MALLRIWPSASGGPVTADAAATDLGVEFYVVTNGCQITGYWWWCQNDTTAANYSFRLYSTTNGTTGTLISGTTVTSGFTLTTGQWNFIALSAPVVLTANTRYRAVSHYSGAGNHYGATSSYFTSGGGASDIVNGPLVCPTKANALNSAQGSFNDPSFGAAFPTSSNGANYWIDVQIDIGATAPVQISTWFPRRVPARAVTPRPLPPAAAAATPGPAGTVQPRATVQLPRRQLARALWRQGTGPAFTAVAAPRLQPAPAPRRTLARAYIRFTPVTTTNPLPSGSIQPRATIALPRRTLARAYVRFTPVTTVNLLLPAAGQSFPGDDKRLLRRRELRILGMRL
jgi:Domain of unknown function (DUF4082)